MSQIRQDVLQIFQNQNLCMEFKKEIFSMGAYIRNFQLIEYPRFVDFKDPLPLAIKVCVRYHPKMDFTHTLPKELVFQCFNNTPLENVAIRLIGETVN